MSGFQVVADRDEFIMTISVSVTPFLWFHSQAEEAAEYYVSLFANSEVTRVQRQGVDGPAFIVSFCLNGRSFVAMNGGPQYRLNEAFSMLVSCNEQDEIDHLWAALSQGGRMQRCGWLTDRYGLCWQIVPAQLSQLVAEGSQQQSERVLSALMTMTKPNIAALERAFEGRRA